MVSSVVRLFHNAQVAIWSISTLTGLAKATHNVEASAIGNSSLTALTKVNHYASAPIINGSSLASKATTVYNIRINIVGNSTFLCLAAQVRNAQATILTKSTLVSSAVRVFNAGTTIVNSSLLACIPIMNYRANVKFTGVAILEAYVLRASAFLISNSTLEALAITNYSARTTMVGGCSLLSIAKKMCHAHIFINGDPEVDVTSMFVATAEVAYSANANFINNPELVANGISNHVASVTFILRSALQAVGNIGIVNASVELISNSYLQFFFDYATATVKSTSVLRGTCNIVYGGMSNLHGFARIIVSATKITQPIVAIYQSSIASEFGSPLLITVIFTNHLGEPITNLTGQVVFYENGKQMGIGTVNVTGTATWGTNSMSVGTHILSANYLGDVNYLPANSNTINHLVFASISTSRMLYVDSSCNSTVLINGTNVCFGQSLL